MILARQTTYRHHGKNESTDTKILEWTGAFPSILEQHKQTKDGLEHRLKVSCLAQAAAVARRWNPSNVISFLDPSLAADKIPIFLLAS